MHSDIDLMLVGEVDLMALSEVVASLEEKLGRAINYLVLSQTEMAQRLANGEPFITNVLTGAKIMLIGEENGLREIAAAAAADQRPTSAGN